MVLWKTYSNWTPYEAHLDQNTKSKMLKLQNVGEHIEGTHGWGEAIVLKSMWGKFIVGGWGSTMKVTFASEDVRKWSVKIYKIT